MVIVLHGAGGAVGRATGSWLDRVGERWVEPGADVPGPGDVRVLCTPPWVWSAAEVGADDVVVAPAATPALGSAVDVGDAGWFGGLGTLLGTVAVAESVAPAALHVAYGLLPRAMPAWRAVGPTVRRSALAAIAAGGTARIDDLPVDESLGAGRRLAWFPRPVGPSHAASVPGHESHAVVGPPTVRTWLAVGSLRSELLQAIGRLDSDGRAWHWLDGRAGRSRRATTADLRWAVVAEAGETDGRVVRAWANGTDPIAVTGGLLGWTASRLAAGSAPGARTVLDVAPATTTLDALADANLLRWSVTRTQPAAP